jgi:hypothetical protein
MIRIFPMFLLSGCISAPIQIPQKECKRIDLPPVPQKVYLNIEGDKILSDAGGELLLRGYVQSRDAK